MAGHDLELRLSQTRGRLKRRSVPSKEAINEVDLQSVLGFHITTRGRAEQPHLSSRIEKKNSEHRLWTVRITMWVLECIEAPRAQPSTQMNCKNS